ncbi:hypothetical protein [Flavobacterium limi]|uniref:Uncharacterized protein n=1 Tax=Flavobacterium limi TaxID=2045105 RepID=A0ABQ1TL39_9FLAO|nr:hypothetical protein [Flavobacterium limi]GGE97768.1 hypothetical protein GCM10011518_04010 [Flavobacterium limi]
MQTKKNNIQILNSKFQIFVFGILFFFIGISSNAQCAMCRAALSGESNIKKAEAVNDGIVFLMVIPYLLVSIIGVLIYRMYKSKNKAE